MALRRKQCIAVGDVQLRRSLSSLRLGPGLISIRQRRQQRLGLGDFQRRGKTFERKREDRVRLRGAVG